jgi:alkanesulfonate monooxygenase SsuD/methylene tetrahydromethanopterin reductase-like flavin-dependent oxidoreductase (luciferase family)
MLPVTRVHDASALNGAQVDDGKFDSMPAWHLSPWVAEYRERIGFSLQVFPVETKHDRVRHLLEAGRLAEEIGFDAFFLADHPAWGPECWTHLAAIAGKTERIRLGTGVASALYRHPVMLARLAADLDNLSGGRLVLGLGCGWDANEFANLGLDFPSIAERQQALDEAVTIIRGVWGTTPFSFAGRHFSTTTARIEPAPLQLPGPPLLIAGGGERVTLRQVARFADACQLGSFGMVGGSESVGSIRDKLDILRRHCEAVGRPYDTVLRTHFTGWLILAEDEHRLRDKVQRSFPGGLDGRFTGQWSGFAMAATVDRAVSYYRALVEAGIQYFVVQLLDAADVETIRILGEAVMPRVVAKTPQVAA